MKLIQKLNDIDEANQLVELFEECGIPSEVNENELRNRGTHIPEGNEVWIYINSQYTDALKLMEDNNHIVENPVNITDFYTSIESTKLKAELNQLKNTIIKYGVISIIIVITITAVYIYAKTSKSVNIRPKIVQSMMAG